MDLFKQFINLAAPAIARARFSKKGDNFYIKSLENCIIINFQKNKDSSKNFCKFTINIGSFSYALNSPSGKIDSSKIPEVERCHWQARIGMFMPGSPDFWWTANDLESLNIVLVDVLDKIDSIAIPKLNSVSSDEKLIDTWLSGSYSGTTSIGRFIYLTTLLKANSKIETLDSIVDDFMRQSSGKPSGILALSSR